MFLISSAENRKRNADETLNKEKAGSLTFRPPAHLAPQPVLF
jgi:hypothetical protein